MAEHKITRWIPKDPGWIARCSCGWESKRAPLDSAEEQVAEHFSAAKISDEDGA